MKSKQLANVLIKITGLYICVCAMPEIISGICIAFAPVPGTSLEKEKFRWAAYAIGFAVQASVGIVLIFKSHALAGFWFKHDDE